MPQLVRAGGGLAGVTIRRGTPDDIRACFDLSIASMGDLFARQGNEFFSDPEEFWRHLEPLL